MRRKQWRKLRIRLAAGATHLDRPLLDLAVAVGHHHQDKGVRVGPLEFLDGARHGDELAGIEHGEGVMRHRRDCTNGNGDAREAESFDFHGRLQVNDFRRPPPHFAGTAAAPPSHAQVEKMSIGARAVPRGIRGFRSAERHPTSRFPRFAHPCGIPPHANFRNQKGRPHLMIPVWFWI